MALTQTIELIDLPIIFIAVVFAYIIFGMVGFGTSLIATPLLIAYLPLSEIIALLAVIDLFAAISNLLKDGKKSQVSEIKKLLPYMIIGIIVGFGILVTFSPRLLLLAFGSFVVLYSLYSLINIKPQSKMNEKAAIPFGLFGGLFGALFGSGGFLYALYLSNRIAEPNITRITQTTLIGFSTLVRFLLFLLSGMYFSQKTLLLILLLIPAMLLGMYIGKHITLRLTQAQFLKIINILVLFSGLVIVYKFFTMG